MSAIFGGGGEVGEKAPRYTGMQIQTSSSVMNIALGYGMAVVAPNLVWYDDFTAIKHKEKSGGKGGGVTSVSYTYTASVIMGLCEGPVHHIGKIWRDNVAVVGQASTPPFTFKANQVNVSDDRLDIFGSLGLRTGNGPFRLTTTGTLPAGLLAATDYWINVELTTSPTWRGQATYTRIKFATSPADAEAGPFVNITTQGTGKNTATAQPDASIGALGFTLFTGTDPQTPWAYLTSAHPDAALAYNGLAYLAVANYDLGSSASLPNHRFEVATLLYSTGVGGTVPDADPALMTIDFLDNDRYGAGFPSDMLDEDSILSGPNAGTTGDSAYQTYCQALGFALSPMLLDSESAGDILTRWCDITNSAPVWSGAALKIIPRGDEDITDNGVTFLAPITPQYELTVKDFYISDKGEDPVLIERFPQEDTYNHMRVEVRNREDNYNLKPCEFKDQASIERFGLRTDSDFKAHEICDLDMGNTVAYLIGQRKVYIRNKFSFKLSAEFCRLEPMDVVSLTYAKQQLNQYRVRITEVEEDDDGILNFIAEEFPIGVATPGGYLVQASLGTSPNSQAKPGPVNAPTIFEPTTQLLAVSNSGAQVWAAVSGQGQFWGGAHVWLSTDGATYSQVGTVQSSARMGTLTATLPTGPGGAPPDTVNTLAVDINESGGTLESFDPTSASGGASLCYVDGELISYETATLTGTGEYDLDNLYRGMYGTTDEAHASGTEFARLDDTVFKFNLPQAYVGVLLSIKFTSFNSFGQVEESLADVAVYTYTPTGIGFNNGSGVDYLTPLTGFTYNFDNATGTLYLTPAGTLATGTIVMPSAPTDGRQVQVFSSQTITALTVSPNTGQSISTPPTTITANGSFRLVWRASDSTWYSL